jgi:hypothetical protein
MRIKALIEKATKAGFSVSVKDGHTTITKGQKSVTIWEDGTILRNDIPYDQSIPMRVYEAAQYLKIN